MSKNELQVERVIKKIGPVSRNVSLGEADTQIDSVTYARMTLL